ncbi:hypothetical protein QZH41_016926, partial [Actinostola sp. cb2023]
MAVEDRLVSPSKCYFKTSNPVRAEDDKDDDDDVIEIAMDINGHKVTGIFVARTIVKRVKESVDDRSCVTSKTHRSYDKWFEERGPYIYTTTTKKINVIFQPGLLSYKQYTKQEFDATLTKEKCPECSENDKMTVLNMAYIGLMTRFKGDQKFSMFMIPNIVQGYVRGLDSKLGSRPTALAYLGNVRAPLNTPGDPAFGPWLGKNPAFVAAIVNATRGGQNYNSTEMNGLYKVLTNITLLLAPQAPKGANPVAKGIGLVTYLVTYVTMNKTISTITNATIKAAYAANLEQVRANMNELLCANSSSCFYIKDLITVQALLVFITSHLAASSMEFLSANNYGLIVTRPVKELVFGYAMSKLPLPPLYPNGVPVPGALVNHSSEADAIRREKTTSLHTCESKTGIPNTWAGFDGKRKVPSEYFPQASSEQLKISGFGTQFTTVPKLSPCTNKYPATAQHFDIFTPSLYQRLRLTYQKAQTIHGIHLNRYLLDEKNFKVNNVSVFMDGIFDLSNIRGIPVSVSAAGFLHGHPSLYQQLSMAKPTFEKYGSIVDIEPVTGRPMNVKYRLQINCLITKDVISAPRRFPHNLTFCETAKPYTKHFPIYWFEQGGSLTKADADYLHHEVFNSLLSY